MKIGAVGVVRKMRSLCASVLLLLAFGAAAQNPNPGVDDIFRPDELAVVYLTMAPADLAFLQDPANAESDEYKRATFRMVNSLMDTTLAKDVGVRLRGNTSRYAEKKSFKIDFREFGGKKFFEYKKFNFKANVNDPSLIREALTLATYREMEIPAARTHHLRLYINGDYMGVYLNVEQVDDVFLNMRYGHEEGFLYKCSYGANLQSSSQVFDEARFESEINTSSDTRAELSLFVQKLNNIATSAFPEEFEKIFHVDRYLRQLAVESLLGHWDGYSYNQNNFYLFYNGETQKVEYIPYDADNTWGIDWVGQDWAVRDLNNWSYPGQPRPLTKRILAIPAYRAQYELYLKQLMETSFNEATALPQFAAYQSMLDVAVMNDPYFSLMFGFTYNDFTYSFNLKMSNHVKYGLKQYLDVRSEYAKTQVPRIVTASEEAVIADVVYPNPSSGPVMYFRTNMPSRQPPAVYSTTGQQLNINVREVDDHQIEITLPQESPRGLYLLKVNEKVFKWVYR